MTWLSIGERIFKIGSVDPEITPYNLTNTKTLPLYNISIENKLVTPAISFNVFLNKIIFTEYF